MSKSKKTQTQASKRPAATGALPAASRRRVKILGPAFKVRWEWQGVA